MSRPTLSTGSFDFAIEYVNELMAHIWEPAKAGGQQATARQYAKELSQGITGLHHLKGVATRPVSESLTLTPDGTKASESIQWKGVFFGEMVRFGEGGIGTASSVAEALMLSNAMGHLLGADSIYYRGEHRYGNSLTSRAERHMKPDELHDGISEREVMELRRFQAEVSESSDRAEEVFGGNGLPDIEDPTWLTAMQHYDEVFGTRLLDLTRSVFAALHFATISWASGEIRDDVDGILYVLVDKNQPWRPDSNELMSGPNHAGEQSLESAFKGWEAPEYFRLYESPQTNPRELAQDGVFLVRGDLSKEPQHGLVLKIRIPAGAKKRIVRELWFSGFTPRRIVRGRLGEIAENAVKSQI